MRYWLIILLLGILAPQLVAQSTKKESPVVPVEPIELELPQWVDEDQKAMMKGEWFAGVGILPDVSELNSEDISIVSLEDEPVTDQTPVVPENEIPAEALPLYRPKDVTEALIDPQNLLSECEREDIHGLLHAIKEATGVDVFLVLFTEKQSPSVELNAPALARHIFTPEKSQVLVSYHYGAPSMAQVIYSYDLDYPLDDEKRKSLLDTAKREANFFDSPTDALLEFLSAQAVQIPGLQKLAKLHPAPKVLVVPKVDYVLDQKEVEKKKQPFNIKELFATFWADYGIPSLLLLFGLSVVTATFILYHKTKRYPMPTFISRPRCGAPSGMGTSSVFSYHKSNKSGNDKILNDVNKQ